MATDDTNILSVDGQFFYVILPWSKDRRHVLSPLHFSSTEPNHDKTNKPFSKRRLISMDIHLEPSKCTECEVEDS